jgi:hypothetical protein
MFTRRRNGQVMSTMINVINGQAMRYGIRIIRADDSHVVFHEMAFNLDLSPGAPGPQRPLMRQTRTNWYFRTLPEQGTMHRVLRFSKVG